MAFVLIAITFFACRKDLEMDLLDADPNVEFRNDSDSTSVDSTNIAAWKSPNDAQFMMVYQDFMSKTSDIDLAWFYHENGFFDWSESQIISSTDEGIFLLSVPTLKDSIVNSVMIAWKQADSVRYLHASWEKMNKPTQEIIDEHGVEITTLMVMTFMNHELHLNGFASEFLWQHLAHPTIQASFDAVTPRGWCLIRVRLYQGNDTQSAYEACDCTWTKVDNDPRTNELPPPPPGITDLTTWDPTYQPGDKYIIRGPGVNEMTIDPRTGVVTGGANIQGQQDADGYTTYYFWNWCPDEHNQVVDANFSTNTPSTDTPPPGSSGTSSPPSTPTQYQIEQQNWIDFQQLDHRAQIMMIVEFETLFGDTNMTFEEFIRIVGIRAFDFIYSGAGGDDTLIDDAKANEDKISNFLFDHLNNDLDLDDNEECLKENIDQMADLASFINDFEASPDDRNQIGNYLSDNFCDDPEGFSQMMDYLNSFDEDIPAHLVLQAYMFAVEFQANIIRAENPDWPTWKIWKEAHWAVMSSDIVHTMLDIGGLFPVVGEGFDLTNGFIYGLEGKYTESSLSFASTIPFAGWFSTAGKWAIRPIQGRRFTLVWKKSADGTKVIYASKNSLRKQLRGILNTPTGSQAHHIIPLQFIDDPLLQAAAKGTDPWHPNELANGINMLKDFHNGSHPIFSGRVEAAINAIKANLGTPIDPNDAATEIRQLMDRIRTAIENNPNTHIEEIIF